MAAHPPSSASIPRSLALARVRSICMALPEAFEKVAWGEPTWRAGEKGKMFAQPTDQARALTVPSDAMEQALLIDAEPEVFFVPPYSGAGGWVGIRLDVDTDWEQVAELLVGAYRRVAAPRLAAATASVDSRALARHALATAAIDEHAEAATARLNAIAAEAYDGLSRICLPLAGVEARPGHHSSFAVAGKTFVSLLNNHHGDGMVSVEAKVPPGGQEILISTDPERFFLPPYSARNGWIGVRVDLPHVDWDEIAALVMESYRLIAPRKLLREVKPAPRA